MCVVCFYVPVYVAVFVFVFYVPVYVAVCVFVFLGASLCGCMRFYVPVYVAVFVFVFFPTPLNSQIAAPHSTLFCLHICNKHK